MFVEILVFLFVYYTALFAFAMYRKDASIVDIFWGVGFVLVAWITYIAGNLNSAGFLVTILVTVWGSRLSWHIFKRNWNRPEDYRYQSFRKAWKKSYPIRAYFQLFLLQGLLLFMISLGFIYINGNGPYKQPGWLILGCVLWGVGFFFEVVGDAQLRRFLQKPFHQGKILDSGLWRYTRHPNYFGEATMWWGIFSMAVAAGAPVYVLISPLTITILVRYISGVPILEKSFENMDGFDRYKKRTNIFFPWFPKKS